LLLKFLNNYFSSKTLRPGIPTAQHR